MGMRLLVLGSCLAASATLAYSANLLIDAALTPLPPERTLRPPRVETPARPLDPERLARTFGTPLRPKPAPAPVRALPLKLVGTLDDHAAALVDVGTGQVRTLRVGDRWNDVELLGVGHGRVTVLRGEMPEELAIGAISSASAVARVSAAPGGLPIVLNDRGGSVSIRRDELERRMPEFMQQAMESGRVVPAFREGAMVGFRVFAVRPGSLYDQLGLKNGDVVESVNGESLSNPQVAFTLMGRLRESPSVSVGVVRGSDRLTWQLHLN